MPPMKQSQLSAPVVVKTNVPYPVIDIEASEAAGKLVLTPHPTDKIVVESASELVERSIQSSLFRSQGGENSPLDIVHDANGQPMIFSIGSDGHLYCVFHVDKAKSPWQLFDITPNVANIESPIVGAFDILEVKQDLHFAVSLKYKNAGNASEEIHQVYWASIKQPKAEIDDEGKLQGFSPSDLKWTPVNNNLGTRVITKLMCSPNPDSSTPAFTIFAATQTTGAYLASTYSIDPNPSATAPWTVITFGAQSQTIIDMQPVVLGGSGGQSKKRAGLALLHDAPGHETDLIRRCNVVTLNDARNEAFAQYSINTSKVGKLSSIYTSRNSWGAHDIVVAGNGIAFHQFQNLNTPCLDPDGQVILPHISFRQVFCKETMLSNPRRYVLSILAVSVDDELYVIDGERDAKNFGLPSFKYSGLPIRGDVAQVACHYNKQLSTMEFIYTTKKDNQIFHLARDLQTSMWTATDLQVQGPTTTSKERQYITTITITNADGRPVPEGYPVSLTSEPLFAQINDLSYRLSRRPTQVTTNSVGQIEIATAAPQQFGVSTLDATLGMFADNPFAFSVNMAARVMGIMSSIKSKDDLKNMTSATGEPLFGPVSDDKLEASAAILSQFDSLKNTAASSETEVGMSDAASDSSSVTLATWDGSTAGVGNDSKAPEKSWISKAFDVAMEYVGDALEYLRRAVKSAVKFVIKVAGPVLRFVLQVGSKVLSFVLKSTVSLVRSIVGVLDNLLGTDLMGLFGLHFGKYIPNIQSRLKEVAIGSLTVLDRFLIVNRSGLLDLFDDAEEMLFGEVQRAGDPSPPRTESPFERMIRSLLNSPIVKLILKFNPLQWVMEGISEGLEESFSDFKLPDFGPLMEALGVTVKDLLKLSVDSFVEVFNIIATSAADALTDPRQMLTIIIGAFKKCFKTVFTATRDASLIVFDCLIRVIQAIPALLTQAWSVPGLTDLWEDWIGQEFSLLNFATYGVAVFVDLATIGFSAQEKDAAFAQPFDDGWTQIDIDPLYNRVRRAADQKALEARYPGPSLPEHTNPIVMMAVTDGSGEQAAKSKKEDQEGLQSQQVLAEYLSLVAGIFRMLTLGIEVAEGMLMHKANNEQQRNLQENAPLLEDGENPPVVRGFASYTLAGFKVVAGVVSVACMTVQNIKAVQNASLAQRLGHEDSIFPNDFQLMGTGFGTIGCFLGVIVDIAGSLATPAGRNAEELLRTTADQKLLLCAGGTMFNVSSAVVAGLSPGCWTTPHWDEISQTFGSVLGAAAVVTTHKFRATPWGPSVIYVSLAADATLTGYSIFAAFQNIKELRKPKQA